MSQKDPVATASKAGLEFAKVFYKTLDTKRHMLGNIYLDDAVSTTFSRFCFLMPFDRSSCCCWQVMPHSDPWT